MSFLAFRTASRANVFHRRTAWLAMGIAMVRRRFFALTALALVVTVVLLVGGPLSVVAGIAGAPPADAGSATPISASFLTDRTLASEPGHRLSEFMVAEDPRDTRHRVAGYIDWDQADAATGCAFTATRDGGRTWDAARVTGYDGLDLLGDPWISIDQGGRIHYVCMARPRTSETRSMWYTHSDDDGATWTPAAQVPQVDPTKRVDKVSLLADSAGRVHVCFWESGSGVVHARSLDGGETWAPTRTLWAGGTLCNGIEEGPQGELYVLAAHLGESKWHVFSSLDGGETWRKSNGVPYDWTSLKVSIVLGTTHPLYPEGSNPTLAVSPTTGHLFLALQDLDAEGQYRIEAHRSLDQGLTFDPLVVPRPTTSCADCQHLHAAAAVDATGRLGLSFTVEDGPGAQPRETWLVASADEGDTWAVPTLVATEARTKASATAYAPNPEHATWLIESILTDPARATTYVDSFSFGAQWAHNQKDGGHYWESSWTDEGFLVTWIDYQEGIPQLWARIVSVG